MMFKISKELTTYTVIVSLAMFKVKAMFKSHLLIEIGILWLQNLLVVNFGEIFEKECTL